jgi:hypothetical protein
VSASGQATAGQLEGSAERDRPAELVRLVTRLVVAQAVLAGAIGLCYSRRNVPWIVLTVMLAIALCGLAAGLRSGTHAAWVLAVGFEVTFVMIGLFRFLTARFLGGTLFAIIALGVLIRPSVASAFGGLPRRRSEDLAAAAALGRPDPVSDPLGGRAAT